MKNNVDVLYTYINVLHIRELNFGLRITKESHDVLKKMYVIKYITFLI
jgi:hypothetical protein